MAKDSVNETIGLHREAQELRKQADGLPEGKDRQQLEQIARGFDWLAVMSESSPPVAKDAVPPQNIIVQPPAASVLIRLYKPGALGLALLLLAAPAWSAGRCDPPPAARSLECPSQLEASPAPEPDQRRPDGRGSAMPAPAAAGAGGFVEDHAVGTSKPAAPRLELPNNDAGVVPPTGG